MNVRARRRTPGRPNQERDAEIYRRTLETGELSNAEAAAEYKLSLQRISGILNEEHQRRHGHARKLPAKKADSETIRQRNAEIYRRTMVTGELVIEEAAREYGTSEANVGNILSAEHRRMAPGERRPAVPRRRHTTAPSAEPQRDRNNDIYHRVVVTGVISASKAAAEYGMTRQRVAQILDRMYRQAHHGQRRPRYAKPGDHSPTHQAIETCSGGENPAPENNSLRNNARQTRKNNKMMLKMHSDDPPPTDDSHDEQEPWDGIDPSHSVPYRQAPTHHMRCGDDDRNLAFFSQQTGLTVPWDFWERCLHALMDNNMIDELAHHWMHYHEIEDAVTILERNQQQGHSVENEYDIGVRVRFELRETGRRAFEGHGRIFADYPAHSSRWHPTPNAPPLSTVRIRIQHQEQWPQPGSTNFTHLPYPGDDAITLRWFREEWKHRGDLPRNVRLLDPDTREPMTTRDLREVVTTFREEQATYDECAEAIVQATTRDRYGPYGY